MANPDKSFVSRLPALPAEEVLTILATRPTGLSSQEAAERQNQYGKNILPRPMIHSLWRQLLNQITHFMALLLWAAGLLAFWIDMPELGWATWAVVTVNACFSFWQEYRADKALLALTKILPRRVKVYRDGSLVTMDAAELTCGDVFVVEAGDHIPADARLLEATALKVDLSLLTGESLPVARHASLADIGDQSPSASPNLLLAGTSVAAGRGVAVAYAIGRQTEFGKVTQLTAAVPRQKSSLEMQIQRIVRLITVIALFMGAAVFTLAVTLTGLDMRESFIFAIGIIIANVPEGLLPTVSLSLAVGVQRMARHNALVRRLSAVESLSATTVICTDKTGTLTLNELTVTALWLGGRELNVAGNGYAKSGEIADAGDDGKEHLQLLLTIAAVCSDAAITSDEDNPANWRFTGDPTEAALLIAAAKGGIHIPSARGSLPRESSLPFDSQRKMMTVIAGNSSHPSFAPGSRWALVKGAPLEILQRCRFSQTNSSVRELTPEEASAITGANNRLASRGHRVLAFAYRPLTAGENQPEQDLIFVGLAAMIDPPRPDVAASLALCRQAGIKVTMLTGDYGLTAEAVGRQIGLLDEAEAVVITGAQIETCSSQQLQQLLIQERPVICARTNPEHKLIIVEAYKNLGHIVAVTGDGVNDAPALRAAHVGIAMGRGGTDVAREVADIILLDDHFATIVKAIEQGRAVYDNIRKFMTYILSSNVPEVVPFIVMAFARIPPALNILQILAIDIGTDMLPALALGAEQPEKNTLRRQPQEYAGDLLDKRLLLRSYAFLGMIEAVLSMGAFLSVWISAGYSLTDVQALTEQILYHTAGSDVRQLYEYATTMTLAAIVACQMGNLFVCRSEHLPFWQISFAENSLLWLGLAAESLITAAIIYVPFLAAIFVVRPLAISDWVLLAACPVILVTLEEMRRYISRRLAL